MPVEPATTSTTPGGLWRRVTASSPWRRAVLAGGTVWVAAHLGYFAVMLLMALIADKAFSIHVEWTYWNRWDTDFFIDIATHGYAGLAPERADPATAFFPLFPLLGWLVNPVAPGGVFAALVLVSNVAFLAAVAVLYRLFEYESGDGSDGGVAMRGMWYLVIFPSGFFLAAGYNVSLAIALSAGCVYAIRRHHWWLAGVLGALASANRSTGILLLVPFAYEYLHTHGWRPRRLRPDALFALLVPAGLAAYMFYTWVALGDPLRFVHAQANWQRSMAAPWVAVGQSIGQVAAHLHHLNAFEIHNLLDLLSVLVVAALLVLSFVGPWRLRRDQWALPLYGIAVLLLIMMFPDFTSAHPTPLRSAVRLVLEAFPAYLILARMGRNQLVDKTYTYLALISQGLLLLVFLKGDWVA
ncbi:MAG TPA: glycosyltransferase 87 family protein [Rugosimonospora sp.]|nr:glycosyltransferase 87 family protein [Rugosimonospora sp.]